MRYDVALPATMFCTAFGMLPFTSPMMMLAACTSLASGACRAIVAAMCRCPRTSSRPHLCHICSNEVELKKEKVKYI